MLKVKINRHLECVTDVNINRLILGIKSLNIVVQMIQRTVPLQGNP